MTASRTLSFASALAVVALALGACSSDDAASADGEVSTEAVESDTGAPVDAETDDDPTAGEVDGAFDVDEAENGNAVTGSDDGTGADSAGTDDNDDAGTDDSTGADSVGIDDNDTGAAGGDDGAGGDAADPADGVIYRVDERIRFGAGESSATVSNAVIRGERDRYILEAASGQTMTISLTSVEENAVADLIAPDGTSLGAEITSTEISLPAAGDYQIIVGPDRGNASYDLTVSIL